MAVRRLTTAVLDPQVEQELLAGLVAELHRSDREVAPEGAPTLYLEESTTPGGHNHWYAVWDRFADVDSEERTRLILEAGGIGTGHEEVVITESCLSLADRVPCCYNRRDALILPTEVMSTCAKASR